MTKLKTGRHTSGIKEVRKSGKKAKRNAIVKSKIRTSVKKVKAAIESNNAKDASECLSKAFSELDRAAKKNVIHFKAASNQKSVLSKLVSKVKNS